MQRNASILICRARVIASLDSEEPCGRALTCEVNRPGRRERSAAGAGPVERVVRPQSYAQFDG
jgi:hypothetical protein